MKLMDIDADTLGIPDTEYDASVTLPSAEFSRIVRDLSLLGESVRIEVSKEGIRFVSDGEAANGNILLKQSAEASSKGSSSKRKDDDDEEDEPEDEEDADVSDGEGGKKKIKKEKVKKDGSNLGKSDLGKVFVFLFGCFAILLSLKIVVVNLEFNFTHGSPEINCLKGNLLFGVLHTHHGQLSITIMSV